MNEKNLDEIAYRRQAFKLFDKGKSTNQILKEIPRSRSWLFKWKRRFQEQGFEALDSLSKTAKHLPHKYDQRIRQTVVRVRKRLQKQSVGLCGWQAVFTQLKRERLVTPLPSVSSIKRWLREAGFGREKIQKAKKPYYPALNFADSVFFASSDWIARYIRGGEKIFAFHTLCIKTHALCQSIETQKTAKVACSHLLLSLRELGLIDVLQVDNDAAFTGLGIKPRIFGQFVRLALYFGIELIFIPPREPKRNSLVERVNGVWATAFWDRLDFRSSSEVRKKSDKFFDWYKDYAPPSLKGKTVGEACDLCRRRKLSVKECEELPEKLPLTTGRIHYIRKVDSAGCIEILKEKFKVSKSLSGQYVFATIEIKKQRLSVYYRRSEKTKAKMLKKFDYKIDESVEKLRPAYKRTREHRVKILQII